MLKYNIVLRKEKVKDMGSKKDHMFLLKETSFEVNYSFRRGIIEDVSEPGLKTFIFENENGCTLTIRSNDYMFETQECSRSRRPQINLNKNSELLGKCNHDYIESWPNNSSLCLNCGEWLRKPMKILASGEEDKNCDVYTKESLKPKYRSPFTNKLV